jgi:hypothetical protein
MKELILAHVHRLERKITTLERLGHVLVESISEAEDQLSALKAELGLDGQPELPAIAAGAQAADTPAPAPARGTIQSCKHCGDYYHQDLTGRGGMCNKCIKCAGTAGAGPA